MGQGTGGSPEPVDTLATALRPGRPKYQGIRIFFAPVVISLLHLKKDWAI
jgi:hypothetical protein